MQVAYRAEIQQNRNGSAQTFSVPSLLNKLIPANLMRDYLLRRHVMRVSLVHERTKNVHEFYTVRPNELQVESTLLSLKSINIYRD